MRRGVGAGLWVRRRPPSNVKPAAGADPRRAQESKFLPKGYPMNTSDVLTRAADLIEERGWTTGNCGMDARGFGPLCLEGAIAEAGGLKDTYLMRDSFLGDPEVGTPIYSYGPLSWTPAYRAVERYLSLGDHHRVYDWNDQRDRTAAEVIEVLRAAALIEAAREDQEAAWATYAELVSA